MPFIPFFCEFSVDFSVQLAGGNDAPFEVRFRMASTRVSRRRRRVRWLLPTTMRTLLTVLGALATLSEAAILNGASSVAHSVKLWRLEQLQYRRDILRYSGDDVQTVLAKDKYSEFPPQWFEQPLDHFAKDSPTFRQRYWVSKRHYKKGGPVIVLDGGETSGEDRLPFLDTGIVEILTKATNGLGVVLEHRYYGVYAILSWMTSN